MKQYFRNRVSPRPSPTAGCASWRGLLLPLCLSGFSLALSAQDAPPVPAPVPAAEEAPPLAEPVKPSPLPDPADAAPATPKAEEPPVAPPQEKEIPPDPPSLRELVNSLSQNDIQEAITALRANFINQDALSEQELNRAALEGLISRLDHGAILEQPDAPRPPDSSAAPFLAEILDERVGYIRLGTLSEDCIGQLDAALQTVVERKIPAVALDLRGSPESSDYALAEQVVSRFAAKGRPLFTIRRPGAKQEQIFTSKSDPTFSGFVVMLVDPDTAGAVETIAGAIRLQARSLVVGQKTQGRAVEYSNVQLSNGRLMRIATGKIVLPPDRSIFPDGVSPDLRVVLSAEDQAKIFERSKEGGMSQFVFETERPRLNEAALVAGTNPSIDAYQEARRNPGSNRAPLRDSVLQRALDVVTSIQIIELKSPLPKPEASPGVLPENVPSPEAQGQPDPPERDED